jgi:hypothetical protein
MKKDNSDPMEEIERQQNMPCVLQPSLEQSQIQVNDAPNNQIEPSSLDLPVVNNVEVAWVGDSIEYVGLDDEEPFKALLSDSSDSESDCLEEDVEYVDLEDDLAVDDALDCETIIHAADLENPTIVVGVTFGDGNTFKKAIGQYAIKGEYEIVAPYSKSKRYRGYCKAARCKWRIHASRLQDGRTWQVHLHFH